MALSRRSLLASTLSAGAVFGGALLGSSGSGAGPARAATGIAGAATPTGAELVGRSGAAAIVPQLLPRTAKFPVGWSLGSAVLWGTTAEVDRTLDVIVLGGGTTVRLDVMWYWVQPKENLFDWSRVDYMVNAARSRGLSILAILLSCPAWAARGGRSDDTTTRPRTPGLYAAFAKAVAKRYKGRIAAYEIWNEPNGRLAFKPDPDPVFYASMVRAAYPVIKAADPSVSVLAGALGPAPLGDGTIDPITFLRALYRAGAGGSFDALSFHPYDYDNTFLVGCLWNNTPIRIMIDMHAIMVSKGDGAKKIWITEYGSPTNRYTQQQQSDLISSALSCWNEVSYGGPFFLYTARDGKDAVDSFGASTNAFLPKTSLLAVKLLQTTGIPARSDASSFAANPDNTLGASVSPVYPLGSGFAQEFDNGSRYRTQKGWFSSPTPVATVARAHRLVPKSALVKGRQDFDLAGGLSIFYSVTTGAHAVFGAILLAYTIALGLAVTDEYAWQGSSSRAVDFQKGRIVWSPTTGTKVVTWG